ncbi:MAG: hypothetical protein D6B28_00095 [Gammaproteobacteria bacterium]|nr:MAG: hypothetical protein D6B28_00095 [Gammaproteobacteria bacterium]
MFIGEGMNAKCSIKNQKRQTGAVLVVGLIMLLIMTLLGITTMHTSVIEEHMSGNLRDKQLAFQAAESAVRDAEDFIESIVSTAAMDGTGGLYGTGDTEPDFTDTWDDSNSRVYSGSLGGVNTPARYRVKMIGEFGEAAGAINIGRYGELKAQEGVTAFLITVRGTGGSDNSVVYVRSYYGRRISG